jgi:hypothetical protein
MILSKSFHLIFTMNKLKRNGFLIIEYIGPVYQTSILEIINFKCFQSKANFLRKLLFIMNL